MIANQIDVISLGCSKNLVDSDALMHRLAQYGYTLRHDPEELTGEIAVVNTCGFIQAAQEESINLILSLIEAKKEGRIRSVYVMGCLGERFREELTAELPEVDKIYGKYDWKQLITDLGPALSADSATPLSYRTPPPSVTPRHYSYIKISEGCDRTCSYCAIPLITGRHHSRPMEEIVREVEGRVSAGCREFQIIAQDSTYYGVDLYQEQAIAPLLDRLAQVNGVHWLRLHYAYPNHFPLALLDVMAEHDNVCKYLDLALQHSSNHILQLMRRQITREETVTLLERIRKQVPGIALRTTMMVGHPGETDEDFADLLDFVSQMRFDRLGAFQYSHEEGTYAYKHYQDDVPPEVKQERYDALMSLQATISASVNSRRVGTSLEVVVDRVEEDYYVGRTQYDSPEVDGEVILSSDSPLRVGSFYRAEITGVEEYDLIATTSPEHLIL